MASASEEKQRPRGRPWRKGAFSRSLLCCSSVCVEKDPLQEQEEKINGGPLHPHVDQRGSGENEATPITLEDLGIVNGSFSPLDEGPLTPRISLGRSVTSVSACARALKRNRLRNLSSLPIQPRAGQDNATGSAHEDEPEEDDLLLFESGADSLLTPPVINLIPPTPSDVVDDDQFFDSEESGAHTSGSDGSFAAADYQESFEEKTEDVGESQEGRVLAESQADAEGEADSDRPKLSDEPEEQRDAPPIKKEEKEKEKPRFLRSMYQVAPLPPLKRSFNTGINLLSFPEHVLDDLSSRDLGDSDMLKTELSLLPHTATMDTFSKRRPLTRSCSLGETLTRSATFHALTQTTDQRQEGEGSPQQRRVTVGSCMPHSTDQNGNFPEKDEGGHVSKSLRALNTEEVCQWFTSIGLQKCLPFIREAKLSGGEIASVDVNTLDILQICTLEDRELLLSAIYNELHPPSTVSQRLDSLLESTGPNNVETFTTTLVSMTKSKSSPHVSCLSMNRRSLKLRNNSQNCMIQRNSQLIEITINASERIVHLRTPKETTVGKIMESCIKMLGVTEDKSLFTLKEKPDSTAELPADQQIGSLLTPSSSSASSSLSSESRQLELHLCKLDKPTSFPTQNGVDVNNSSENGNINKNLQGNQPAKEERIKELNQQVDSLQNVVLQIQELHHGLVAFCSELKSAEGDVNVEQLGSADLKQKLELVNSRLNDKRQSLQTLRDNINNFAAHKKKQLEVRLLEKMKLNCQVFKEEITIVHLNRQVAHLQNALQESLVKEKAEKNSLAIGSLSQLVSPQSPAMLLVVQEHQNHGGQYGFTCSRREGSGLAVVEVDDSHLCVDDRLVEVNGVPVVNATPEELADILSKGPSAQIIVIRQPPPTLTSPLIPQQSPEPELRNDPEGKTDTMETPPQRKVMAI